MNQAELEMYRTQLDLKIRRVTLDKPMPAAVTADQAPVAPGENGADRVEGKRNGGGYGKGYGARTGAGINGGRSGNLGGGSMNPGGGRNR